jgi:DNA-binding response OmpR family regulator
MSARGREEDIEKGYRLRANDYILESISTDFLIGRLKVLCFNCSIISLSF